jgi:LytS/YehU family sensor histidine kinase
MEELGPRFLDMSEPYKKFLIQKARDIAARHGIAVKEGVYVCVTGPTYETRAEYKLVQAVGGDVVGMSTVQEAIVANHMGMEVFALSVVTDLGIRDEQNIITHEEVLQAAQAAEPRLSAIIRGLVESIASIVNDIGISGKLKIDFTYSMEEDLLSPGKKVSLFRIVQEQVKNIMKYSQATEVTIKLDIDENETRLVIRDNGIGFDPGKTYRGIGLSNIHDRARFYNGSTDIQSSPGKGCLLTVTIPTAQ